MTYVGIFLLGALAGGALVAIYYQRILAKFGQVTTAVESAAKKL